MFQIELREYPILWAAAHTYWALYEDGMLIGELHGLATDRRTGESKAVGTRRDQLRTWCFPQAGQPARLDCPPGGFSGLYMPGQASEVVFEGADAQERWRRATLAGQALTDANIEYRALGGLPTDISTGNSNGAWRTFAEVMGVDTPKLKAWIRPGGSKNLLPRETYAGLYEASVLAV